jgi:tetrahydromethanopterin S-methyltransferase subunit C
MNLAERVKGILLRPKEEWETVSGETTTVAELYRNYVIILAAIGPAASVIGTSVVGISMPFMGSFRVPLSTSVTSAVVQYVLTLAGVYVLALVINKLSPMFAGEEDMDQAVRLAAYSSTPAWLAGIFAIIPALSVLGILGLYSLYLLYLGLPILVKSPREKSLGYTIATVVAAVVIFFLIGAVSRVFISSPPPASFVPGMR